MDKPLKLTRFLVRVYNANDDAFYTVAVDACNSRVAEELVINAAGSDRADLQHIEVLTMAEALEEFRTVFTETPEYTQTRKDKR